MTPGKCVSLLWWLSSVMFNELCGTASGSWLQFLMDSNCGRTLCSADVAFCAHSNSFFQVYFGENEMCLKCSSYYCILSLFWQLEIGDHEEFLQEKYTFCCASSPKVELKIQEEKEWPSLGCLHVLKDFSWFLPAPLPGLFFFFLNKINFIF